MHLLIDADSALYRAGCSNETRTYLNLIDGQIIGEHKFKVDANIMQDEVGGEVELTKEAGPLSHTISNLKHVVKQMRDVANVSSQIYIGGKGNFRFDVFPEYKKDRKASAKPIHIKEMKDYLIKHEGAIVVDGEEVDDRVSWEQYAYKDKESCIVTIDKDLDNSKGYHYNYVTKEIKYVTEEEAQLNFARQLLSGDTTDSIPGLKGIGKRTAIKRLPFYIKSWMDIVISEYNNHGCSTEYLTQMGVALHMRRKPNEIWSLDYDYKEFV